MNSDQLNSLVRSVLKIAGAVLMAHGATKYAAIVNTEDMAGVVVTIIGMWLSHQTHGVGVQALACSPAATAGEPGGSPVPPTYTSGHSVRFTEPTWAVEAQAKADASQTPAGPIGGHQSAATPSTPAAT